MAPPDLGIFPYYAIWGYPRTVLSGDIPAPIRSDDALEQADPAWLAEGLSWEQVHNRMRPFDAGLAPLALRT